MSFATGCSFAAGCLSAAVLLALGGAALGALLAWLTDEGTALLAAAARALQARADVAAVQTVWRRR